MMTETPITFSIIIPTYNRPERLKTCLDSLLNLDYPPDNFEIILTSWVKDISSFNPGMDLICLTSLNEGTPVSLIEAQAANIPILTTDVGGVRDIVKENVTGYVVSNNSLTEFAEKLLFLIENDSIRNEMSQNGWEFVKSRFHYTTLVKNMENYYSELINKRNDQQQ